MPLTLQDSMGSEELQMCIPTATIALLHAATLLSVHEGPSQIHYSLNTVSKIF